MRGRKFRPGPVLATTVFAAVVSGFVLVQRAGTIEETEPRTSGQPLVWRFIGSPREDELLARDLIGAMVTNRNGEHLAKADDLILEAGGEITGIVLSLGGFMGIGDRLVAVPWSDVAYRSSDRSLVLDATPAQLEIAPSFTTREPLWSLAAPREGRAPWDR